MKDSVIEDLDNEKIIELSLSDTQKNTKMSLVHSSLELIDANPDIHSLFLQFNDCFFQKKLDNVEIKWSKRMTLCAGLCVYQYRAKYCCIKLSEPLLKYRTRKDLIETLLHEMIHAYLFVTANNKDRESHGPEFRKHMHRINCEAGTNITIYHSFYNEVKHYRRHWWKCNGQCQYKPPFYGFVKRAINRAPGPNDSWWSEHAANCSGKFIKVCEPENFKLVDKSHNKTHKLYGSIDLIVKNGIDNFFIPKTSKLNRNNILTDKNSFPPLYQPLVFKSELSKPIIIDDTDDNNNNSEKLNTFVID